MWFYDNWGKSDGSLSRKLIFGLNVAIFILGAFVTIAGVGHGDVLTFRADRLIYRLVPLRLMVVWKISALDIKPTVVLG
jgi:hypothetical protein